jgi:hypothetical protein
VGLVPARRGDARGGGPSPAWETVAPSSAAASAAGPGVRDRRASEPVPGAAGERDRRTGRPDAAPGVPRPRAPAQRAAPPARAPGVRRLLQLGSAAS